MMSHYYILLYTYCYIHIYIYIYLFIHIFIVPSTQKMFVGLSIQKMSENPKVVRTLGKCSKARNKLNTRNILIPAGGHGILDPGVESVLSISGCFCIIRMLNRTNIFLVLA